MKKQEIVEALMSAAKEIGVVAVLSVAFGKGISLEIAFDAAACEVHLDDVGFSTRAENALKRAGVFTIGGVIELIEAGALSHIRNLGKKTESEIKTRVLVFGFDRLTDKEKRKFFLTAINRNCV